MRGVAAAAQPAQVPDAYKEGVDPEIAKMQEHQQGAARPSAAEVCRTIMALARYGTLCTLSTQKEADGFPYGSVVEFAADAQGRPIFATSTLSPHTADLTKDGRCSLTVMAPAFRCASLP